MGDSCCNIESIGGLVQFVKEKLPGANVLSVNIVNDSNSHSGSSSAQIEASYFGDSMQQVDNVCEDLSKQVTSWNKNSSGINLIGFSQGKLGEKLKDDSIVFIFGTNEMSFLLLL